MQNKGFPDLWIKWMRMIFNFGTSTTLLNGVSGKVFHYKRGVIQGNPLSPLLFVFAADFLQSILNAAKQQSLLTLPLNLPHDHDFPILQYADDTLIFMETDARQLFFLKAILNSFAESTRLRVNYSKSMMIPVNISDERFDILAQNFGCSKGSLPFTYLGLPLSLTRPSVAGYWPLVSKCERRLSSVSSFLNEAGQLQITNAVLTMPCALFFYLRLSSSKLINLENTACGEILT